MMLSLSGFAQVAGTHFTVGLANVTSTSTTMEMDVTVTVDGSVGSRISAVSVGINYNVGILNGGLPCSTANCGSWTYIGGKSPVLAGLTATTNTTKSPYGHLRIVGSTISGATSIDVEPGTYVLGRYKYTNTVAWTA